MSRLRIPSVIHHSLIGRAYYSGVWVFDPEVLDFVHFDSVMSARNFIAWVESTYNLKQDQFVKTAGRWNSRNCLTPYPATMKC